MPDDTLAVGIDLGTTHSVVAVFRDGRAELVRDEDGETLMPSVVALDDGGRLLVGRAARERWTRGAPDAHARFKSDMGTARTWAFGGRQIGPVGLSAMVLRELRVMATASLGVPVDRAVISVPAWFREPQRRATIEAAHAAGLEVTRLINEPTAAALHYGSSAVDDEPRTVAVLDLGGGTFDVTLLELYDGVADVRGTAGDVRLGGEDVTDAVCDWLLQSAGLRQPDAATRARAFAVAERAKRALSELPEVTVAFDGTERLLVRDEFERLVAPLRARLEQCVREVLLQTGIRPEAVDEVLLVGGASRMPFVAAAATRVLGRPPRPLDDVDHAVALGAAVQAGLVAGHAALRERLVTDVLTHSLGVGINRTFDGTMFANRFDPILHRGTTLPASRTGTYQTLHQDQREVILRVYEGEHREVHQNHLLGEVALVDVPPHPDPGGRHDIEVRFTHDTSGLLEVEARIPATGQQVSTVLTRGGTTFDAEEKEALVAQLSVWKTHPRELLPNRWLVERATTAVTQLTGGRRAALDTRLTAFEAALEAGDPTGIEHRRLALRAELDALARDLDSPLDP